MAESSSQTRPPGSSQYHHFIPRFLLRNFADFKNPGKVSTKAKKRAPRPQKLEILDLKAGTFKQGDVGDTFGIVDMYRDFKEVGCDQQKLERELSVLESAAGEIVARIKRMYEAGKMEVQLLRKDKDTLRRFLFIMMYRNSSFARRFETSRENYDSDDREIMLAYMDEKGFQTPRDVWFANIRAFLEVKLEMSDTEGPNSLAGLTQRAYPMDARWFIAHIQAYFIAFCTPKKAGDEFLLTQNVYSTYEGPTSATTWMDYHRFAPVSPKIMVVMRSLLLPRPGTEEDLSTTRQIYLELAKSTLPDPDKAGSYLADMPVSMARNNYSKVVNGKIEPLPTKLSRDKHMFYFPFFSLDHEHVQKINMICLDNAYDTLAIVYKSPESLRTALEIYLTDKSPGFKAICGTPSNDPSSSQKSLQECGPISHAGGQDKLLPYLKLLLKFARQLGSAVELEYNGNDELGCKMFSAMRLEWKARYARLGGTSESILQDFDQARRIVQLVAKVDNFIGKYSVEIKYVVRRNREDLIATLPPRRVWLSVKFLRNIDNSKNKNQSESFESDRDKEDAIVDGKPTIIHINVASLIFTASRIFKADSLSRMMYSVFDIDYFHYRHPNFGLVNSFTFDDDGAKRTTEEIQLVFTKPGSIRNCGIAAVEKAAKWLSTQPHLGREVVGQKFLRRILSDEQMLELWVRQGVEKRFDALLEPELGSGELRALKNMFFQSLYRPEFGGRMRE